MAVDFEALGITKEELLERIENRIVEGVLTGKGIDEDGDFFLDGSPLAKKLQEAVRKQIDATINALAEKHVLPNVHQYVENLTLEETNRWGEKKGQKLTFIEYLIARAEAYMQEEVDFDGKSKAQSSLGWSKAQTRITHLVNQHLHYSIKAAMEAAVKEANSAIAAGIQETVKVKLAEIVQALKVNVATK